jgi:peptidoglycan hydrolase-like protein with peptidoglycan-binding domain
MAFKLTWLPEVLKDAGLKVAEQSGWKTRGHGDMGTVKGIICHHTAGSLKGNMPSLGVVTRGTSKLSGPLAQLGLGRDGTFYVIAAGRAFHAGKGLWQGVSSGNSQMIGIEAENTGRTKGELKDFPWPEVQMDAYRRGCAAILSHIGADPIMCCGHKEYRLPKGFKIDPTFDMNVFRQQVAEIMNGTAPKPILIPVGDEKRPTLRRGAEGKLVEEIQAKVGVKVDGDFGPKTEAAVRAFQREAGLVPDGIVGPRTWASLMA